MYKLATKNIEDLKELIQLTAARKGLTESLVEKDFWVCLILDVIFSTESLKNKLIFKGGTSLSKVYGLINRFSEDIDLILDWQLLGITDVEAFADRSNTKQDQYNKKIDSDGVDYIKNVIVPSLTVAFSLLGLNSLEIDIDPKDGHNVYVNYPRLFSDDYLLPHILLEIGPRASKIPSENAVIKSFVEKEYEQHVSHDDIIVKCIKAKRTFWEKITILHFVSFLPETKVVPSRYSRHFYDTYQMIVNSVADESLQDIQLLGDVVAFKKRFYRDNKARYDLAVPGTIKLIPSPNHIEQLRDDYFKMQNMIFGASPSFEEIMNLLEKFEYRVNHLLRS